MEFPRARAEAIPNPEGVYTPRRDERSNAIEEALPPSAPSDLSRNVSAQFHRCTRCLRSRAVALVAACAKLYPALECSSPRPTVEEEAHLFHYQPERPLAPKPRV